LVIPIRFFDGDQRLGFSEFMARRRAYRVVLEARSIEARSAGEATTRHWHVIHFNMSFISTFSIALVAYKPSLPKYLLAPEPHSQATRSEGTPESFIEESTSGNA